MCEEKSSGNQKTTHEVKGVFLIASITVIVLFSSIVQSAPDFQIKPQLLGDPKNYF